MIKPLALVILDGFGYNQSRQYNAIAHAHTPHLDRLFSQYPHTLLHASGTSVGLPEGAIGNSQVGHITIGAGRVVEQPITRISSMIAQKELCNIDVLKDYFSQLAHINKPLHIMGLFSDKNVHSNLSHAIAYVKCAIDRGVASIIVHAFLDGRDTPPRSAKQYLQKFEESMKSYSQCQLGSLHGRFYAMDRDHHWDRTEKSYIALTQQKSLIFDTWHNALDYWYSKDISDEFIEPTQLRSFQPIKEDDGVLFFNTRPDRAQQLTAPFVEKGFNYFPRRYIPLTCFITPVAYSTSLHTNILIEQKPLANTLKERISNAQLRIYAIAETEKYAHITYFLGGGRELPFPHEIDVLIDSLPDKSYAAHPRMSAPQITNTVITSLQCNPYDVYIINYANADMVGHSGNFDATVKAIECLDHQINLLYKQIVIAMQGTLIITADHGNAELMFDRTTHQPMTRHTTNKVPFIVINNQKKYDVRNLTQLADIAPFIYSLLDI